MPLHPFKESRLSHLLCMQAMCTYAMYVCICTCVLWACVWHLAVTILISHGPYKAHF